MFLIAILCFILGTVIGSFLNIYRRPTFWKESVIIPQSHCPQCDHPLKPWENIRLLSYLVLKGKCRYCRQAMPFQYPLVEFALGLLFLVIFLEFKWSYKIPVAFFFASILVVLGAIDMRHKVISNKIILPALAAGLFLLLLKIIFRADFLPLLGASNSAFYPLLGVVLGGGLLFVPALIKEEWMGGGDVKLGAFMGLFLGGYVLIALFLGSLIAATAGIVLILLGKLKRKDSLPFGPFLALGAVVTLFFGPQICYFYHSLWI